MLLKQPVIAHDDRAASPGPHSMATLIQYSRRTGRLILDLLEEVKKALRNVGRVVLLTLVIIYLLFDLIFLSIMRPIRRRLMALPWLSVSGGENPRIDGDVAGCEWSAFCGESAVALATVKDARRRFAVAFGHP